MLGRMMGVAGAVTAGVAATLTVFMLGMRAKWPPVLDTVRRLNRGVLNPRQMASAGTPGAYASVIRHHGRVSGKTYETPIGLTPTDGGFLVALPYGTRADWVRNVLAGGTARVVTEGQTYEIDQPKLVPTSTVIECFPPSEQRALRLFNVDQCLQLHTVAA